MPDHGEERYFECGAGRDFPSGHLINSREYQDLELWSEHQPLSFRIAVWWARYMPRGKAYVSRLIGKFLVNDAHILIRTRSEALLAVTPCSLDTYTYVLVNGRVMAGEVIDACCHLLDEGMVFFDIGANAGVVTLEVANKFRDSVTICAFEPQEAFARNLAVSLKLNAFTNASVHQLLVGNKVGFENLFIPNTTAPTSHASLRSRTPQANVVKCRMETIDSLVSSGAVPAPNLIKMDVEGAELSVLQGAKKTIEKHNPIVIFESDTNSNRFGYTRKDVCEFLLRHGTYRFLFPTPNGLIEAKQRIFDHTETDVVAVPKDYNHRT